LRQESITVKRSSYVFHILASIAIAAAIHTGCGRPAVKHTSIFGEVRKVLHWKVIWAGKDQPVEADAVAIAGLRDSSKYTLEEYCATYVGEVKDELASTYGYSLAENFPELGRIEIRLTGEKFPDYVPPEDTSMRDLNPDTSPDGRHTHGGSGFKLGGALYQLFTDQDYVRGVHLRIFDHRSRLAGEVFIGGSLEDRVKPDFTARVIDEILRTGRYKGSKGPSVTVGDR
jgi:hypothetical protein